MYRIFPPDGMVDATVRLPLSKSERARTLIMDAVAGLPLTEAVADCDDTRVLRTALADIAAAAGSPVTVDVMASGTALRFLAAYCAATAGCDVVITGTPRLCQRPVAGLVDALRAIGAEIEYTAGDGHAPLHIRGRRLQGGSIAVDGSVSSQFVSALMLVAPAMENGLDITVTGLPVSVAYSRMTAQMMQARGVDADFTLYRITVPAGKYAPAPQDAVTADWSAASYWYSVTALTSGWVTLPGLSARSPQGDREMAKIGERLGVVTGVADSDEYPGLPAGTLQLSAGPEQFASLDWNASDTPDLVQTVAVAAALLGIRFDISGVRTLHDKETDRVAALIAEAAKLGLPFEADGDNRLVWDGSRRPITAFPVIDTYDDHRMAMAFAPVSVFLPGLCIRNPQAVAKSYPGFWDDMTAAGFIVQEIPDDADPTNYPLPEALTGDCCEG